MGHEFDCPRCDRHTEFRTKLGGAIGVFAHFFVRHGSYSFRVGFPFTDAEAPEPEEFVQDPQIETQASCGHCGEEWSVSLDTGCEHYEVECPGCGETWTTEGDE